MLFLALLLDAVFGEPRWLWSRMPHPAVIMGRAVSVLDRHWNKGSHKEIKGSVAVAALVIGAGLIGWGLSQFGILVSILCAAILLAQKSLVAHVQAVANGLRQSKDSGRAAVAMIVSRDTSDMTPSDTSRAAIESLSENFSDGVIAPAFWFLIAGLPGIAIYKVVNTADSMIGYRTPRHEAFGWAAARLDASRHCDLQGCEHRRQYDRLSHPTSRSLWMGRSPSGRRDELGASAANRWVDRSGWRNPERSARHH